MDSHYVTRLLLSIFIIVSMLMFTSCKEVSNSLDGKLIVPMATDVHGRHNLYSIDLENNGRAEVYFEGTDYDNIRFPAEIGNGFICVAKNLKKNYYTILKVSGNEVREIFKANEDLYYPILINDNNIIFIKKENQEAYLYKYNIQSQMEEKVFDGKVDPESRPVLASDGSLLFVSNESDEYIIRMLKKDGSIKNVVKGGNPFWLEEGKKLIYYTSWSLHIYDIENNKDRVFKKNIVLIETPVLSPDKRHIVFYEYDKTVLIGSETSEFLSVMTIEGKKKTHIKAYSQAKRLLGDNGIMWLAQE